MGFIKCPLHVDLLLLSQAAFIELNNVIEELLHGLRPDKAADLAPPSLNETTVNLN